MSETPDDQRAIAAPLTEWREYIARLYLRGIIAVMPIAIGVWLATRRPFVIDGPVIFVTSAWASFVLARLFAPARLQAAAVVALLALIGFVGPAVLGLSPGPFLSGLSAAIFAGAIFGRRLAFALLGVQMVSLFVLGVLASQGALPMLQTAPTDPSVHSNWLRLTVFTALTGGLLILVLTGLFERVEAAWRATAEAAERERLASAQRKAAEERIAEAQRLEAIGRLAGGVAHDFNNLLVVIMTWADLLQTSPSEDDRREGLGAIREASAQAAQLTRQLLSFARKGTITLGAVDVEATIASTVRSLRRLLPDDVKLEHVAGASPAVLSDASQLGQVLLNLAVNARDAMPRGGTLTIRSRVLAPPELPSSAPDRAGSYVAISVSDTGQGMSEVTRQRVFEPFFTTKEHGRGSGLGLAMVYGVATQARGFVEVTSKEGEGSTFTVAFPVAPEGASPARESAGSSSSAPSKVTHRILLVEDDLVVRGAMARALRRAGIEPLEASNADEGLQLARRNSVGLDLLCTDGVMPGTPTHVLIEGFRQLYPRAPILVCSGHVEEELLMRGITEGTVAALPKPFTAEALVKRINDLLAGDGSSTS